jgi:ADP-ribose pyrophosphatase YjhB (NUDIX family)
VLQQRSPQKETWGGLWDVSVGGHYRAGEEDISGGLREIAEELGLDVAARELIHVGWRREEAFYPNGLIEREVQDIYFLLRPVALTALAPEPGEVAAVAIVPATALGRLAAGRLSPVAVAGGPVDPDRHVANETIVLTPEQLVPRSGNYYGKATRLARALATGAATVRRRRWW